MLLVLQERFYFGDNVLPCFESGVPLLLKRLQELPDSDNVKTKHLLESKHFLKFQKQTV